MGVKVADQYTYLFSNGLSFKFHSIISFFCSVQLSLFWRRSCNICWWFSFICSASLELQRNIRWVERRNPSPRIFVDSPPILDIISAIFRRSTIIRYENINKYAYLSLYSSSRTCLTRSVGFPTDPGRHSTDTTANCINIYQNYKHFIIE